MSEELEGEMTSLLEQLKRWRPAGPPPSLRERVLEAASAPALATAVRVGLRCGYCHGALPREAGVFCAGCLAPHHSECWDAHGGCTAAGCGAQTAVRPEQRQLRVEPARWRRWALGAAIVSGLSAAALVELRRGSAPPEAAPVATEDRPSTPITEAAALRERARPVAEAGQVMPGTAQALRDVSRALELDPGAAEGWLMRAALLAIQGDLLGAEQDLTRACAIDAPGAEAWTSREGEDPRLACLRGQALLLLGRPALAIAAFDRALAKEPQSWAALVGRGRAKAALASWSEALQDLSAAIELDSSRAQGWYHRATVRAAMGKPDEAQRDYEIALDRDQDMALAELALVPLRDRTDDAAALAAYERLIERTLARGKPELAAQAHLALADRVLRAAEPVLCRLEAGSESAALALCESRRRAAREHYAQALARDATLTRARLGRARLALAERDWKAACAEAETLLRTRGTGPDEDALRARAHGVLGVALLQLEEVDAAERAFRGARALDTTFAAPFTGLAVVALKRGNQADAANLFAAGRTLAPLEPVQVRPGHRIEAHRLCAARVAEDPLDAQAWLAWATLALEQRAWDAACALAVRAVMIDPALARGRLVLARAALRTDSLERPPAAGSDLALVEQSAQTLVASEHEGEARLLLALACVFEGDLARASDELERALEAARPQLRDGDPEPGPLRIALRILEARREIARRTGNTAREDPEELRLLQVRARAAAARELAAARRSRDRLEYAAAIEGFARAQAFVPDLAEAMRERGACYMKLGNFIPGILELSRAMELDSRLAEQMYKKVYQISYVVDLSRVIAELDQVVAERPEESHVVFLRGFFHVAKTEFKRWGVEDVEAALADFERTLVLNPAHVSALLHRGWMRIKRAQLHDAPEERARLHARALGDLRAATAHDPLSGLAPYLEALAWSWRSVDPALAEPARADCRERAVAALELAFQRGFEASERIRTEKGFDPVREDPRVQALLGKRAR